MTKSTTNIDRGLKTIRSAVIRNLLIKGVLLVFSAMAFYASVFCVLDWIFGYTYRGRFLAFAGFLLAFAVTAFILLLKKLLKGVSDEEAALIMQSGNRKLKDDIINAVQLKKALAGKAGSFSRQIAEEFVSRTEQGFKQEDAAEAAGLKGIRKSLAIAAIAFFGLILVVSLSGGMSSLDRLFNPLSETTVSTEDDPANKLPPELGDIRVRVYYPKYTGLGPREIEQGGNASVLRNSELVISAAANKLLRKATLRYKSAKTSDSILMNIKGGIYPEVRLKATEDFEYRLEAIDNNGSMNKSPEKHTITVINDEKPKVVLIFPAQDLLVSPKAELKVVYEYSDDFGVSSSNIIFEKRGQSYLIQGDKNKPAESHKVSEYLWDLGALGLAFGEAITFQVEVFDNDTEGGPKRGVSDKIKLQVPTLDKYLELTAGDKKDSSENLLGDTKNLYERNSEFLKSLEKFKKDGKFDVDKLMGDLDMLFSYLNSFFSSMADMAQMVPEEMMNKGSTTDLGLKEINDLMSKIREAVEKGDFELAEKLAKELSAKLSELMKKMADAMGKSRRGKLNKMKGAAGEAGKEIDEILNEEKDIYSETLGEDLKNKKELIKEQENLLLELAKMQEKVVAYTREFSGRLNTLRYAEVLNAAYGQLSMVVYTEEDILKDFKTRDMLKTREKLGEVIRVSGDVFTFTEKLKDAQSSRIEELKKNLSPADKTPPIGDIKKNLENTLAGTEIMKKDAGFVSEAYGKVRKDEQEILDLLKKASGKSKKGSSAKSEKLKGRQGANKDKMKGLKKKIDELAEMGADIPGMQADSEGAEGSMESAEGSLGGGDMGSAVSNEQKAINHLENLKEAAQGLSDKLGQMAGGSGGGMMVIATGKSGQMPGGVLGTVDGHVKMPAEKDYKPPKEFREDIMDSLKEKMPEKDKDEVEEYYRKLLR